MGISKKLAELIAYEIIAVIIIPYCILSPMGIDLIPLLSLAILLDKPWISTANSNAKLAYTNAATYCTECEVNNTHITDGVYCISLTEKTSENNINIKEEADGTPDSFYRAMLSLMGGYPNSGYCVILISENRPVISYWSVSAEIFEYESYLSYNAENGLDIQYSPQEVTIGCYPYELIGFNSSIVNRNEYSPQIAIYRSFTDKQLKKYIFEEKTGFLFSVIEIVLEFLLITQFPLVVYLIIKRHRKLITASDDNDVKK